MNEKQIKFYKKLLEIWSSRSTCLRTKTAAILLEPGEKYPIAFAYNGNPRGVPHCEEIGCIREKLGIPSGQRHELCTGAHAEQNVLIQAKQNSKEGAILITSHYPCSYCMKSIINEGIKKVYYVNDYNDDLSKQLAKMSKLEVIKI
jgi:dCMP deaminase